MTYQTPDQAALPDTHIGQVTAEKLGIKGSALTDDIACHAFTTGLILGLTVAVRAGL